MSEGRKSPFWKKRGGLGKDSFGKKGVKRDFFRKKGGRRFPSFSPQMRGNVEYSRQRGDEMNFEGIPPPPLP